jgi:hypothetical protein
VGIYRVGVFGAGGFRGAECRDGVLRYRVSVSLNGVRFFWIEQVCVGVGGEFSRAALLGWASTAYLAVIKLATIWPEPRRSQERPRPLFRYRILYTFLK